jgi:single-stranded-DNA-specific exonuclease
MARRVTIQDRRLVGAEGKHLKLLLSDGGFPLEAIAFRMGEESEAIPECVDVAYRLELNEWNGQQRLQLQIEDIRPLEE